MTTPSHAVKRYSRSESAYPWPDGMFPDNDGNFVTFSDYDHVRKQRDELLEKSEWKPIETAPRDKAYVLTFAPNGRSVSGVRVAHFHTEQGWLTIPAHYQIFPSHWMPLPDEPNQPIAAAEKEGV